MSVNGASVLAANEREAKMKQWSQRKAVRDKTFELLGRLNTERADEEDSLREVAITICAAEKLLQGSEINHNATASANGVGAKAASGQKTLKSAFMRWTAEHHTFNNVVCTPADMATFGGGLLEYIQTNKDEETGEEINTIPSLKFFTPGVPKPGDKPKPITPDQKCQNVLYTRECNILWRAAREEVKERVMEYVSRASRQKDEQGGKAAHEEETSKMHASSTTASLGSNVSSAMRKRFEVSALQDLSMKRLTAWIEDDDDKQIAAEKELQQRKATEAKISHEQFVRAKDGLRIRMPTQEQCAETFTSKNKMSYGRALEGVRPQKQKGPQTTVELMAGSGLKYVHATHKGRQGLDGDLERSRKQLLEKGIVRKENFDINNPDSNFSEHAYRKERVHNEAMNEKRDAERKMKEESSKAFDAWIQLKDMRDEALSCLGFIAPPQVTPSTSQGPTVATNSRGRLNNAEVRGSRNGSMNNLHQNSIATPLADVMTIGKSLKMVDRTLLADWAKWAGNIMSFNTASILWDSFPPTACDVHSAQYSQVRETFLKLLRPGLDYKQVFKDIIKKKFRREGGDDAEFEENKEQLFADGSLSKRDMVTVLKQLGLSIKPTELRVLIDSFDANGDGVITLNEFVSFIGPKRDKRGGSSLCLNQRCCWMTTCKTTGMANAFSVSAVDPRLEIGRGRDSTVPRGGPRDEEDSKGGDDASMSGKIEYIELSNGERRCRVELKDRVKRMDVLHRYNLLGENHGKKGKKHDEEEDEYGEDFDDADAGASKKGGWDTDPCAFSLVTMEQRQVGLNYVMQYTSTARREAELKKLLSNGSVPKPPKFWSAHLDDVDVTSEDFEDPNDNENLCTELLLRWAPADKGDLVSFFSVECAGQAGKGGSECNFTEIFRDPPDANPESVFNYSSWYRGNQKHSSNPAGHLLPGASYSFRIRCFNGYGPGEYTYKVFTTRPAPPVQPKALSIASDSVSLKWVFTDTFYRQMDELRKIFAKADVDGSGCICREELAVVLDGKMSGTMAQLTATEELLTNNNDRSQGAMQLSNELKTFLAKTAESSGIDLSQVCSEVECCRRMLNVVAKFHLSIVVFSAKQKLTTGHFGKGYAAVFDMIEQDDNGKLSWEEFERFFVSAGWTSAKDSGAPVRASTSSRSSLGSTSGGAPQTVKGVSYVVESCVNEFSKDYADVVKAPLNASGVTVKHLTAGKSYRFRVYGINVDGVKGPSSIPLVVHTMLDTPTAPVAKTVECNRLTLQWKDRNQIGSTRDKTFVKKMLGDWAGSSGQEEDGVSIESAFFRYDKDKSGTIDLSELAVLLEDLGVNPTEERLHSAFLEFDDNKDGVISFEEFAKWWRRDEVTYTLKRSEILQPLPTTGPLASTSEHSVSRRSMQEESLKALKASTAHASTSAKKPAFRQVAYPTVCYQSGKSTKLEVAGLSANCAYQFVLRLIGSRSCSILSNPLYIITAPNPPLQPVLITVASGSARVKLYSGSGGLYKFVLQIKSRTGAPTIGGTNRSNTAIAGIDESHGWSTVFNSQDTIWTCTTLASDTDYVIRVFAVNAQGAASVSSPEMLFRTGKRAVKESSSGLGHTGGVSTAGSLTAANVSLHSQQESRHKTRPSSAPRPGRGSTSVMNPNSIRAKREEKDLQEMRKKAVRLACEGRRDMVMRAAEANYIIECRTDICVGDTILFTERIYLKQKGQPSRYAEDRDGSVMGETGSVVSSRTVGGKTVVRVDHSGDGDAGMATLHSLGGQASYIGERTIAAHVVRDNYRTLQNVGAFTNLKNKQLRAQLESDESNATKWNEQLRNLCAKTVDGLIHAPAKAYHTGKSSSSSSAYRRLGLEVLWQRSSSEECKPYELKPGEIIERNQGSLQDFEVFRCRWEKEGQRQPYVSEVVALQSCFAQQ